MLTKLDGARRSGDPASGSRAGTYDTDEAGSRTATLVIALATALALLLRLYQVSRPGMLLGAPEYDDGEYLGSAIRLAGGALPYRDFAFVQPPGITLLMSPLGVLAHATSSSTAMATARILTACAGAGSVVLAGLLVRHRGWLATAVTCGILAVFPDAVGAATTLFLEPWLVLMCLIAALIGFHRDEVTSNPRRLVWSGVAFGFATAIKVWAAFPAVVFLLVSLRRRGLRLSARFLGGAIAGFCVPVLPLFALAPRGFIDGVVVAQLHQADVSRVAGVVRLVHLLGLKYVTLSSHAVLLIAVALVAAVAACTAATWRLRGSPPRPLESFALGAAALVGVSFWVPMEFFNHYAAFFAPFLALVLGLSSAGLVAAWSGRSPRAEPTRLVARPAAIAVAGLAAIAFAWMAVIGIDRESSLRAIAPAAAVERQIPAGACVITDNSAFTIVANRFIARSGGCTQMVDATGTDMTLGDGRNALTGAGRYAAVETAWMQAFRHAQYVYLSCGPPRSANCHRFTNRRIPWTAPIWRYFTSRFKRLGHSREYIYVRTRT